MSTLSRAGDLVYTYRFLKLLTTKWTDMEAYELGLIDDNGKKTKKKAVSSEEKSAYTLFHRLVFNLKRLIEKLPLGKAKFANYAAALFLLKEEAELSESDIEDILDSLGVEVDNDLNESWMVIEDALGPGEYTLVQDIASPTTGEVIAREGTVVLAKEDCDPVDTILGIHIYEVKHQQTSQNIFISIADIKR